MNRSEIKMRIVVSDINIKQKLHLCVKIVDITISRHKIL